MSTPSYRSRREAFCISDNEPGRGSKEGENNYREDQFPHLLVELIRLLRRSKMFIAARSTNERRSVRCDTVPRRRHRAPLERRSFHRNEAINMLLLRSKDINGQKTIHDTTRNNTNK